MERINDALTSRYERVVLAWLCQRLPGWVTSDMLTAVGVFGAALCFVGYWQSLNSPAFLWLACVGLLLNWFGDSLDGSLARARQAERRQYGFFLDHMTDTLAMGLIALGIGASPFASFVSSAAVLIGYYAMVILTLTTSVATGVFRISFNRLGPTEIRLFIIACTLSAMMFPPEVYVWQGFELTAYDAIMLVLTVLLVGMCFAQTVRTLRSLAIEDPPRR
jgi:phosphatidylglycerophosphate synthase